MAFGGFGGGFMPIAIDVDGMDEMEIDEGPVVAAEWEGPAEVMTLEDRLAMYDPIEVTFLDRFKAEAAQATALPAALEGWEDVADAATAEAFADEEVPEALPAEAVARALERIAILEREVAEGAEAEEAPMPVDADEPAMEGEEAILGDIEFAPAGFFVEDIGVQGAGAVQSTATIDANWKGGNEGLKDLAALEGQVTLTFRDAPLTDEALQHVAAVKNLASLAIFGGKLSAPGLLKFHREHPQVQISARSNGWMGINAFGTPCQVENIVDNSAAEQAGLEIGDVVLKINGAEIKDFTELTLAMASQGAGDVVRVSIERDGKAMEIPVKLHARP
jgi:hypothetical protein